MEETDISPRLALSWISNLPNESAFVAAYRGGAEHRGWGVSEHLLANVLDALAENTYVTIAASNPKKKPSKPKPFPRPGDKAHKKNNVFASMAAKKLEAVRKAKEGK